MADSSFLLNTDQNIQKLYINQLNNFNVPGDFSYHDYTIQHDLGYIAAAKVWFEGVSGQWYPMALTQLQNGTSGDFLQITGTYSLTPNSLIISLINFSGSSRNLQVLSRIYLDN